MNQADTTTIAGALCVQRGTPMLQAFATAATIAHHQQIDIYIPENRAGYQREPIKTRVRRAAQYYGDRAGRMPNPLLINIRKADFDTGRAVIMADADQAGYDNALAIKGNWIGSGRIVILDDLDLWIYDGQHRVGGLGMLLGSADEDGLISSFSVPLSITLGLEPGEEMREFYEVNTNAASVKTDLAWQLLTKMAETDPELREILAAEDRDWITRAYAVADELEKLEGPWRGRFREANSRHTKDTTLPKPQFARSLKPVLDMPTLKRATAATIAAIINAYWRGIKQVMPEPFEDAANFVLQKGNGTVALHRVLPQVIEIVRSEGGRLGEPEGYAKVMENLPTLEGEAVDNDGQVSTRSGAEYWRVGSYAAAFSGDAGRRRLGLLIQSRLPSAADTIKL